jgi:ribosomal-protein-alanine N-acetyltransferase
VSATYRDEVPDLEIRTLTRSELPDVMLIERDSFSTPWRLATFEALMIRGDSDVIGALRDGHLVGYAVCWTVGDQAELGNVAVARTERRRGVGRQLVSAALDRLRARGARECFLEVRESNLAARTLYEAFRFQNVGRRRHYYTKPSEDALVMRRDLL